MTAPDLVATQARPQGRRRRNHQQPLPKGGQASQAPRGKLLHLVALAEPLRIGTRCRRWPAEASDAWRQALPSARDSAAPMAARWRA